jgi:hypothetical protein
MSFFDKEFTVSDKESSFLDKELRFPENESYLTVLSEFGSAQKLPKTEKARAKPVFSPEKQKYLRLSKCLLTCFL